MEFKFYKEWKICLIMTLANTLALLALIVMVGVYLYLTLMFRKKYISQKAAGFRNTFLIGYAFMFLFLMCYQAGYTIVTIIDELSTSFSAVDLQEYFPGMPAELSPLLNFIKNLIRPIFVIGLIAAGMLFAAQAYPLESMIGWKKTPGVKIVMAINLSLFLIFIPSITWTTLAAVLILACCGGMAYGLFINIAVNIKLIATTTGVIKRRSIIIILASALFYLGFVWSLKVGWSEMIHPYFNSYDWDTVFGSILIIISTILYRTALLKDVSK